MDDGPRWVAVVGDQLDQDRVERDVAVVVELADRDAQPERVADADHGVVAQRGELPGAHAGAGEQLDHQSASRVGVDGEGGHELGGGRVVEELRERLVGLREVTGEDRHLAGGVVVVPVDDPFEERAQQPEVVTDRGRGQLRGLLAGPLGKPTLVVLEMASFDRGDAHTARIGRGARGRRRTATSTSRRQTVRRPCRHRELVRNRCPS